MRNRPNDAGARLSGSYERAERAATHAPLLAMVLITAVLGGCGDRATAGRWTGTVDTLPGGAVRVSNPAEGLWDETTRWSLVEDLRLGTVEGDSPEMFGRVADIEVDDDGRIYVLDADAAEIRAFGPDGAHLRTFGRRGEGPGEFGLPSRLARGPGGRLWVVDLRTNRYSLFDSAGRLVEEMRRFTSGQVAPWPGAVLHDGRVVDVELTGGETTYTLHRPDGTVQDTVALPSFEEPSFVHTTESSRVRYRVPFAPHLARVLDPRGYLWTGISDDYRIVKRSVTGGDSLRVIRRAWDPVPVTAEEVERAIEGLDWFREQGGRVDRSRIPGHHPAFYGFVVDRLGFLWVEPVTPSPPRDPDREGPRWRATVFDVFDEEGLHLGRLEPGLSLRFVRITGPHLYGVTVDELGVQFVVRLRIEGREAG